MRKTISKREKEFRKKKNNFIKGETNSKREELIRKERDNFKMRERISKKKNNFKKGETTSKREVTPLPAVGFGAPTPQQAVGLCLLGPNSGE